MKMLKWIIMIMILMMLNFTLLKADNQIYLNGETFAYGVNAVTCKFASFNSGKIHYSDRRMVITGEFNGMPLGYLTSPTDKERDNLYFVTLVDKDHCSYNGNPDNVIKIPKLGEFFASSPFRGRGSKEIYGEERCPGILRTQVIPSKSSDQNDIMVFTDGGYAVWAMGLEVKEDKSLNRKMVEGDGKWFEMTRCAYPVINMDYIALSNLKTDKGENPFTDDVIVFSVRNGNFSGDHNAVYASGFQTYTVGKKELSSYKLITIIEGHPYTPWDRKKLQHGKYDRHLMHGGMLGVNQSGEISYIFSKSNSCIDMWHFGKWEAHIYNTITTHAAIISQQQDGNINILFETPVTTSKFDASYVSKGFGAAWNERYLRVTYPKGGPSLDISGMNQFTYSTGDFSKYPAYDSLQESKSPCGIAKKVSFTEYEIERNKLINATVDPTQPEILRDFLTQNGKIKVVCYGLPYGISKTKLPSMSFSLENYTSTLKDSSNGFEVERETGKTWAKKDVFETSLSVSSGYSKSWGQSSSKSTTKYYQFTTDNEYDIYNTQGMMVYVKGQGYVSGYVELQTLSGTTPMASVKGVRYEIPFTTYFAQTTPSNFEIQNFYFDIMNPSESILLEGVKGRDFNNIYDGSEALYDVIENWERSVQLSEYLKLMKDEGSGIEKIESYEYYMGSGFTKALSIDESTSHIISSSWYSGSQFKTSLKPGYFCEVKGMYKGSESFTKTEGKKNGFTFTCYTQDTKNRQGFTQYVVNVHVPLLKSYLANQNKLQKEKPFFVPDLNWNQNEDFILVISETNPHLTVE